VSFFPLAVAGEGAARKIVVGDLTTGLDTFEARNLFLWPPDAAPGAPLAVPPEIYSLESTRAGGDTWFGTVDTTGTLRVDHGQLGQTEARLGQLGYAFELADLDGDGVPEAAVSDNTAPGTSDSLLVRHLKTGPPLYKQAFKGASIVGIASGKLDGVNTSIIVLLRRRTSKGATAELEVIE
jgi:hypothetical protein